MRGVVSSKQKKQQRSEPTKVSQQCHAQCTAIYNRAAHLLDILRHILLLCAKEKREARRPRLCHLLARGWQIRPHRQQGTVAAFEASSDEVSDTPERCECAAGTVESRGPIARGALVLCCAVCVPLVPPAPLHPSTRREGTSRKQLAGSVAATHTAIPPLKAAGGAPTAGERACSVIDAKQAGSHAFVARHLTRVSFTVCAAAELIGSGSIASNRAVRFGARRC